MVGLKTKHYSHVFDLGVIYHFPANRFSIQYFENRFNAISSFRRQTRRANLISFN